MPSASQLLKLAVVLGSVATVSAHPKFGNARPRMVEIRQLAPVASNVPMSLSPSAPAVSGAVPSTAPAAAAPAAGAPAPSTGGNLTDVDILQFALTLEHLESTFYNQGFAKFQDSDFMALGLNAAELNDLKSVGGTEGTHVQVLSSAISAAGAKPVEQCTYNFNFTTAANMLQTARILEAVGISAYLGAAPLVKMPAVLSAAASIVTIEARHQSFIRTAQGAIAVPNAFDSALGPRAVFTLAAPFIASCPPGSNLNIQPFPAIALQGGGVGIQPGQMLVLANPSQPAGAAFCAFIDVGQTMYAPITNGACQVPQNLSGEAYMMVTNAQSIDDNAILAGPSVLIQS